MLFGIVSSVTSGSARVGSFVLCVVCLLVGVALDFFQGREHTELSNGASNKNPFVWLLLTYLAVVAQSIWLNGLEADAIVRSLPGGALVAAAALASHRRLAIHPMLLRFGLLAYLATGVILGFAGTPTTSCRADKCSPIGVLYKGGFTHENMMGWASVLAAIVVLGSLARRSDRQVWLLGLASVCAALAVLSGARTSLYAAVATAIALAIVMLFQRGRALIAATVPVLCVAMGVLLIHIAQPEDFSTRGRRWVVIRDSLDGVMSLFGNGLTAWVDLQPLFNNPTSTHSIYGTILVQGGMLALIPFALFLVVATRRAQRAGAIEVVVLLHFIAFQGMMETVWEPAVLVQRGWVLIAVALTIPTTQVARRPPRDRYQTPNTYLDLVDRFDASHLPVGADRGPVGRSAQHPVVRSRPGDRQLVGSHHHVGRGQHFGYSRRTS